MLYHRQLIQKWALYGLLLCFACILQISLPLKMSGLRAMPLMPLATAAAVFEGPRGSAAFGFVVGLVYDAFVPGPDGFFAIYLLVACFAIGLLVQRYFKVSLFTALFWYVSVHAAACILYFLFFLLVAGKAGPQVLLTVALPELLLTLPYLPLAYAISRSVHKRFDLKY